MFINIPDHIKKLTTPLSISILNQVASSGTNFFLGLYLVRILPPDEFGLYGIGFSAILFYIGIGNALFLTQMVVHTPDKILDDRLPYASRILAIVFAFGVFTACLVLAGLWVCKIAWPPINSYVGLIIGITSMGIAYLFRDFFVRHAYNFQNEKHALWINIALFVSILFVFFLNAASNFTLSAERVFFLISIAYFISAFYGFAISKLPIDLENFKKLRPEIEELLHGGKWSVFAHIIISLRSQAYTFIVAGLMGSFCVARLNAARIFIAPATMMAPAIGQIFLPRIATARRENMGVGYSVGYMYSLILFGITLIYSILILSLYPIISPYLIKIQYGSLFWLVFFWCIINCLSSLSTGQEITLLAFKLFKLQAHANIFASIISLSMVYLLVGHFAEIGALTALSLSELFVIILLWYVPRKTILRPQDGLHL